MNLTVIAAIRRLFGAQCDAEEECSRIIRGIQNDFGCAAMSTPDYETSCKIRDSPVVRRRRCLRYIWPNMRGFFSRLASLARARVRLWRRMSVEVGGRQERRREGGREQGNMTGKADRTWQTVGDDSRYLRLVVAG